MEGMLPRQWLCILTKTPTLHQKVAAVLWTQRNLASAIRRYSEEVHDHFQNPRNVGSLDKKDPNVGTAVVGKAACGDVIKLQVKVEEDIVQDVKFKTFGCGSAIASSSYASELIKGKTTEEALKLKNTEIAAHLKLPPVKFHCSLLAEDAVRHAIEDYRRKQQKQQVAAPPHIEGEQPD